MEFHPATDSVRRMNLEQFQRLVDSIDHHGLEVPIEVVDGMIVDGRERYEACLQLGIEPKYVHLSPEQLGGSPEGYVSRRNIFRRHVPVRDLPTVERYCDECAGAAARRHSGATRVHPLHSA